MHSQLLLSFHASRATLRVGDLLDAHGEAVLRRRIADALGAGCARLDVDCSWVGRIDPPALRSLAEAKAILERRGGRFTITGRSAAFTRAAMRAGFRELLTPPQVPR